MNRSLPARVSISLQHPDHCKAQQSGAWSPVDWACPSPIYTTLRRTPIAEALCIGDQHYSDAKLWSINVWLVQIVQSAFFPRLEGSYPHSFQLYYNPLVFVRVEFSVILYSTHVCTHRVFSYIIFHSCLYTYIMAVHIGMLRSLVIGQHDVNFKVSWLVAARVPHMSLPASKYSVFTGAASKGLPMSPKTF